MDHQVTLDGKNLVIW